MLHWIPALGVLLSEARAQDPWPAGVGSPAPPAFQRRVWREEHGLPSDRIKDIVQTRDGYLWLGTSHGLARFDGVRFTVFNRANTTAFRSDDCWLLGEDAQGVLWIATMNGLLGLIDGRFERVGTEQGLTDNFIGTMTMGRQSGVWVGTAHGLSHFQDQHWTTFPVGEAGLMARATRLHEDAAGKLWIGTTRGLQLFDPGTATFSNDFPAHPYSTNQVYGIHTEADGTAWILYGLPDANSHLMRWSDNRWTEAHQPYQSRDGKTLLASTDSTTGFWRLSEHWQAGRWIEQGPAHTVRLPVSSREPIIALLEDHEENVWAGTANGGLWRLRRESSPAVTLFSALRGWMTWSVAEDAGGILWAATDKGLARLEDGRLSVFKTGDGLNHDSVRCLGFDSRGRTWVGTLAGLNVVEGGNIRHFQVPGEGLARKVRAIVCATDESLWLGTDAGVYRHSAGSWTSLTTTNGLADDRAPLLLEDRSGAVWIGTLSGGLHRWHDGKLNRFTTSHGLPSNHVTALFLDSLDVLWVGTDQGIARLEGEGFRVCTTPRDGPIDTPIRAIIEDDSRHFWIYASGAIYGVRRDSLIHPAHGVSETPITRLRWNGPWMEQPATPKSQPTACKTRDGQVLLATTEGVMAIDSRKMRRSTPPPPVRIEQVIANGATVLANAPVGHDGLPVPSGARTQGIISLAPGRGRLLEFHFTVITLVDPERLRFKYRLDGLDNDWVHAGTRRTAHYNNLPPGRYQFRVMACDEFQDWPVSVTTLPLHLAASWHETLAFQSFVAAVIGLSLLAIVRWRFAELRKLHALERQLALTSERSRLARDLHDQLGSEVTRAMRLSERLDAAAPHTAGTSPGQLRESLFAMRQRIDAAVWAVAPDKDSLGSLIDFTADRARSLLDGSDVELDLVFPGDGLERPLPPGHRHELAMVVLEAVHNVLRHAQARHVQIVVTMNANVLSVEIKDDGRGLPLDQTSWMKGATASSRPCLPRNGVTIMKARAEKLRGTLTFDSQPGFGTRILVRVPLPDGPLHEHVRHKAIPPLPAPGTR